MDHQHAQPPSEQRPASAAQREQEALESLLKPDSPKMKEYKKHEASYHTSLKALHAAELESRSGGKPASGILRAKVQMAREAWENNGFKAEIEKAMNALHELRAKKKIG